MFSRSFSPLVCFRTHSAEVGVNGEVLIIHNITRYCGDSYECVAYNGVHLAVNRIIKVSVECEFVFDFN